MKPTLLFNLLPILTYAAVSCPSFSIAKCQFFFEGNRCPFSSCTVTGGDGNTSTLTSRNWTYCISSCCDNKDLSIPKFYKSLNDLCPSKTVDEDE